MGNLLRNSWSYVSARVAVIACYLNTTALQFEPGFQTADLGLYIFITDRHKKPP